MGKGRLNKNAIQQVKDAFVDGGGLISREVRAGVFEFSNHVEVVRYEQTNATIRGRGRPIAVGSGSGLRPTGSGITNRPTSGVLGAPPSPPGASGIVLPSSGTYTITGFISVSGTAGALFKSDLLLDNEKVLNTTAWAHANSDGAAFLPVHGLVNSEADQALNVQVTSPTSTVTAIGAEDLDGSPHMNITVFKLSKDAVATNI